MPTAFEYQLAKASTLLDQQFGELVTIRRGTKSTADVLASWMTQDSEIVSPDGQQTLAVDRSWLVAKSQYVFDGEAAEPRTADTLTDSLGTRWEVLPSIAGPAVLSFAGGADWEIKTKKVA